MLERPQPAEHAERRPDPDAAERLRDLGPFVVYFGKLLRQKGVHTLLDAWRGLSAIPGTPGGGWVRR